MTQGRILYTEEYMHELIGSEMEDIADHTLSQYFDDAGLNRYTRMAELQETFQTAGSGDIVVYSGETYHADTLSDPTGLKTQVWDNTAENVYSMDEMISDINKHKEEAPSMVIVSSCSSAVLAGSEQPFDLERIVKETNTRVAIGLTIDINAPAAEKIGDLFKKHFSPDLTVDEIVDKVNNDFAKWYDENTEKGDDDAANRNRSEQNQKIKILKAFSKETEGGGKWQEQKVKDILTYTSKKEEEDTSD